LRAVLDKVKETGEKELLVPVDLLECVLHAAESVPFLKDQVCDLAAQLQKLLPPPEYDALRRTVNGVPEMNMYILPKKPAG
jgi:hypothetical protein